MQNQPDTPAAYIDALPEDRKAVMQKLRDVITENLPEGFMETMSYGMIGYVVPQRVYPAGYHCDPKLPLPFISLASQKNFVAVHHMGLYADEKLMNWFMGEYPNHSRTKPDMGKSCIRFKKIDQVPVALIGALAGKMSAEEWIRLYEEKLKK